MTHPSYDADTVDNDVALLRLPMDVRPDRYRGFACLPRQEQELPPAHRLCTIIGWGKKRSSDAFGTDVLHEATVYFFVLSRLGYFSGQTGKKTLFASNIFQEAGWAPGPVWMSAENLASTGIIFCSLYIISASVLYDCPSFVFLSLLYNTQTFMPLEGFEPAISASDQSQALALDRWATGIGIRSSNRPARSESLYRLSYPCPSA